MHRFGLFGSAYLVPTGRRHAIDILLVRIAAAVYDTVAVAIAIVHAGAPLICDIPVAP
jgi:hypothetical protein